MFAAVLDQLRSPLTGVLAAGYDVLAITYLVRYAILIVLAITAPLAGLFFMLPETHHVSKMWASHFTANLLMQPFQLFVLAIGANALVAHFGGLDDIKQR